MRDLNNMCNTSFIIGYYQGLIKGILTEIKDGNKNYVMSELMIDHIEDTLYRCNRIWEERYDKTHDEILRQIDSEKN